MILMDRKGIGRPELARYLGLDRSTLAKWASGDNSPRKLEAVAEALGVTVAEIYNARQPSARRKAAA